MSLEVCFHQVSPYVLEKIQSYPVLKTILPVAAEISNPNHWRSLEFYLTSDVIEQVSEDIPQILEEGEDGYLALGPSWYAIHWFLTGDSEAYHNLPFLVTGEQNDDDVLLVNAVCGGTMLEEPYLADSLYLMPDEVQEIADALLEIANADFNARWEMLQPPTKKDGFYDWFGTIDAEELEILQDIVLELADYYQEAVEKRNAILIRMI